MSEACRYDLKQLQPGDNLHQINHVISKSEACLIVVSSKILEVSQVYICILTDEKGVLSSSGRRTSQRDAGSNS